MSDILNIHETTKIDATTILGGEVKIGKNCKIVNARIFNSTIGDNVEIYDSTIEITDKNDIEKIYNIFYNRTTNKESVSKNPENADEVYHIIFYDKEDNVDMYIYANNDKYYLEQTDNGIYETSLNDFNTIKEYIDD